MAAMFPSSGVSYPRSFPCLKRSGKNKKGKSIPCLFLISIMLTDYDVIKNRYGVRKSYSIKERGGLVRIKPHQLGLMMSQIVPYHKIYL